MKIKQTIILRFSILLISGSFLSSPVFGEMPSYPNPQIPPPVFDKALPSDSNIVQEVPCPPLPGESLCDPCQADENPVSLQETLERTYMQNATLDAARAGLRVTDENLSQANADWRPSLSAVGTQSFEQDYNKGPSSRRHFSETSQVTTLSQNIYKGGGTEALIGQQENLVFSGKADLFTTEQTVLFNAVSAHADVIANQDIVKYRQDSVAFFKKFLERTQARFEVGEVGRTDVEASLSDYEGAKGDLSEAIGQLEAAKAKYKQIVACSPDNLKPANILLELPRTYEEAREVACTNNPTITAQRFKLEAALYNVDLQFSELLPKLDAQASVGNFRRGGESLPEKQTALKAAAILDVPIYLQGKPSSRVRQAYQQVAQEKVNLVQTEREVEQNVKTAWENHIAAREALKRYLAAVKAGEITVEGATAEADAGTKSVIDVLERQKDLIQVQIQLVGAQRDLVTTTYGVLQAMGSLMASVLKLNVTYYDPDAYYYEYKDAWIQFWQSEDWRYVPNEPCGPICNEPRFPLMVK